MQLRIHCYLLLAFLGFFALGNCKVTNNENNKQSQKNKSAGSVPFNSFGDYPDDQEDLDVEGSGRGGGEVHDDLEASGSGLGPDDEDGDGGEFTNHNTIDSSISKTTEPKLIENTIHKTKPTNINVISRVESEAVEPLGGEAIERGEVHEDDTDDTRDVYIMNPKHEDRASSFFAQPGVLAAVIGGAVVGLLCAILVVMFIVYRMRKKDEGSYALDEPRRSPAANAFPKPGTTQHNREFYA